MFGQFDKYDRLKFKHGHFQLFFLGGWVESLHKIMRWLLKSSQIILHAWQLAKGVMREQCTYMRIHLTIYHFVAYSVQPLFLLLSPLQPTFCNDISNEWLWNSYSAIHLFLMQLFSNCNLESVFCCCFWFLQLWLQWYHFLMKHTTSKSDGLFNWVCASLKMLSLLFSMPS